MPRFFKRIKDWLTQQMKSKTAQWVLGCALLLVVIFVGLWKIPQMQLPGEKETLQKERLQLENEFRKTLAQIIGGAFILLGAFLAWKRITIAQEGQITERFTRAIGQLGDRKNLEVRLGGIYALERIAKDLPKDHWTIMEVLTAYIREKAPLKKKKNPPPNEGSSEEENPKPESVKPKTDIQAILTVIGRRTLTYKNGEDYRLDLRATDLGGADLRGANLSEADFSGADLRGANLNGAHFRGANLNGAHFRGANLSGAHLRGANLSGAYLWGANLSGAYLWGANLSEANLGGAHLSGAHLRGADLRGASLEGVKNLTREQLEKAQTDDKTILPDYLRNK